MCTWLCMCVDVNVCLSTALPAPIVTISPASDVLTVGQSYTLTCTVMVVPHLVVEPTIQWTKYDGTACGCYFKFYIICSVIMGTVLLCCYVCL